MHNPRDQITLILFCFACILVTGYIINTMDGISKQKPALPAVSGIEWMTIPITDAVTGKQTSIVELGSQEKPIIVHTFAVWCPACSMQLRETKNS